MNTLWNRENIKNEIADTLEILNEHRQKYRIIENEILDGIEKYPPTKEDADLLVDVIHVKDALLRAYDKIQKRYEEKYKG